MTRGNTTTVLRRERMARGWTTRELAAAAGISRQQLWKLEFGHVNPDRSQARIRAGLVRALGVPFEILAAPDTKEASAADPKVDDGREEAPADLTATRSAGTDDSVY